MAEPLCRDLCVLTRRRAPAALVELELSKCVWSAEAGACIAALTSLTRLRLERLECVRPARASASASRAAMSVDLQPLVALRGMRCFEVFAATGSVAGVLQVRTAKAGRWLVGAPCCSPLARLPPALTSPSAPAIRQGLGKLWSAWAPTLEDVKLVDLSVSELDPWATLPALGACGALTSLRLLLREPMAPELVVLDVGALPQRLQQLALRHVVLTCCDATQQRCGCGAQGEGRPADAWRTAASLPHRRASRAAVWRVLRAALSPHSNPPPAPPPPAPPPPRMTSLASVSLRQCTVVRHDDVPPLRDNKRPLPGSVRGHVHLLQQLPALRSVELVAMPYLCDEDFVGIGKLTALTTLLVCASGTIEVSPPAVRPLVLHTHPPHTPAAAAPVWRPGRADAQARRISSPAPTALHHAAAQVTHAALQAISTLTRLRQLRWHVGDVTDLLPDVAALKSMQGLVSLHLPSYLHGQFSRWCAWQGEREGGGRARTRQARGMPPAPSLLQRTPKPCPPARPPPAGLPTLRCPRSVTFTSRCPWPRDR
jgi:hypothetical protein